VIVFVCFLQREATLFPGCFLFTSIFLGRTLFCVADSPPLLTDQSEQESRKGDKQKKANVLPNLERGERTELWDMKKNQSSFLSRQHSEVSCPRSKKENRKTNREERKERFFFMK
jgi:hypothetical protein